MGVAWTRELREVSVQSKFLLRAIELASRSVVDDLGGPFGAVIVRNGTVLAEGWNVVTSANDPTAHAEVSAIREACKRTNHFSLDGCEIYSSCEPCPMCLAAIYWARIEKIFYAADATDAKRAGFDDAFFYEQLHRQPSDRAIPAVQAHQAEAQIVFDLWLASSDRTPY